MVWASPLSRSDARKHTQSHSSHGILVAAGKNLQQVRSVYLRKDREKIVPNEEGDRDLRETHHSSSISHRSPELRSSQIASRYILERWSYRYRHQWVSRAHRVHSKSGSSYHRYVSRQYQSKLWSQYRYHARDSVGQIDSREMSSHYPLHLSEIHFVPSPVCRKLRLDSYDEVYRKRYERQRKNPQGEGFCTMQPVDVSLLFFWVEHLPWELGITLLHLLPVHESPYPISIK